MLLFVIYVRYRPYPFKPVTRAVRTIFRCLCVHVRICRPIFHKNTASILQSVSIEKKVPLTVKGGGGGGSILFATYFSTKKVKIFFVCRKYILSTQKYNLNQCAFEKTYLFHQSMNFFWGQLTAQFLHLFFLKRYYSKKKSTLWCCF